MSPEPLKLLIDTNVWIDRYQASRPRHQLACDLISTCVRKDVTVLYPMRALQDVYYQVIKGDKDWVRKAKGSLSEAWASAINQHVWECIDAMSEIGAPVGADVSDVWLARHLRDIHPDFEDDMVLAAAERAKVDFLVTSDQQLIKKATVAALAPEDMLSVLRMR